MKISENTIADIIRRGDSTTMYEIIRTLIRNLNERDERLKAQEQSAAKMGTLYVKTEADRDRFRRMAEGLVSLCREIGQEDRADRIVRVHGGLEELDGAAESEGGEITIELE